MKMEGIYVLTKKQMDSLKSRLLTNEFNKCIRIVHEIELSQYIGDTNKELKDVMSSFRMGI